MRAALPIGAVGRRVFRAVEAKDGRADQGGQVNGTRIGGDDGLGAREDFGEDVEARRLQAQRRASCRALDVVQQGFFARAAREEVVSTQPPRRGRPGLPNVRPASA